ncbi:hypothetical protein [Dactylosporangium matsuzakiense]|uniref:EamA domain-containing protein n=1 Tax=Dactylosporangium matsuzakiense TaxID=53360 RepID=A0A9W6KC19_9ACTN|nr:hypothetical protein [Dactylosporangium matsuzakiense]GLK99370.1 hypothetical protein GCM10017581_011110 [Dactylosporangium matsuzakiense]
MIDHRFVLLALAFNVLGAGSYMLRLLRTTVQPHIITWSIWALAPAVAFAAQRHDGVGLPSAITLFTGISPAAVVVVLLIRGNYLLNVTPFDVCCGLLSIVGLVLWLVFRQTGFAVGFAILSDGLASLPTMAAARALPVRTRIRQRAIPSMRPPLRLHFGFWHPGASTQRSARPIRCHPRLP